jgi:hypothetical protein
MSTMFNMGISYSSTTENILNYVKLNTFEKAPIKPIGRLVGGSQKVHQSFQIITFMLPNGYITKFSGKKIIADDYSNPLVNKKKNRILDEFGFLFYCYST